MLLSSFWKCQLLLSQATSHWFLASQSQQGREHVSCSVQILLEAAQVLVSGSNIWPWSVHHSFDSMKSEWFCSQTKNATKQRNLGLPGKSSSSKRAPCMFLIRHSALYHSAQLHWPQHFAIALHQWLHHEATSHWFLASQWQQEENMLAPFKSCWRPCRSSFQGPTSGPDHTNLHCCRACLRTPTRTSKLIPCFSVAARTCYITAPFKSCWRLCRSFQQVLSVSNIWPCSATRMPNLSATATLSH